MGFSELNFRIAELEESDQQSPLAFIDRFCKIYNPIENFQLSVKLFVQDFSDDETDLAHVPTHFRTYENLKRLLDGSYVLAQMYYERRISKPKILVPMPVLRSYMMQKNGISLDKLMNKELRDPASFYTRLFADAELSHWHWILHTMLESACTNEAFWYYGDHDNDALKFTKLVEAMVQITYYINASHDEEFSQSLKSSIEIDSELEVNPKYLFDNEQQNPEQSKKE